MAQTAEPAGWTSRFREIVLDVDVAAHDLSDERTYADALRPDDYSESQRLAANLRRAGSEGIVYPSTRHLGGECVALFYPDLATNAIEGRHLDYHWDGVRVDFYREVGGDVYQIANEAS